MSFVPKLYTVLKDGYSKKQFSTDVMSGVIVGVIALPLAIAFAIASGVTPEKGLYTAIVAGFIISVMGGSRVQIGGPTGAFIVIVFDIVNRYGVDGLTIATFMAGFMILLMGLTRLGSIIKFIPYSLVVGFTSGIALIIFSSQLKDFFGFQIENVPADFLLKWKTYFLNLDTINFYALGIGAFSFVATMFTPRLTNRIPGSLIAIIVSTLAVIVLKLPVETIESRFGEIPSTLPLPGLPDFDWERMKELFQPAFTIALLGAIESLLSAVVSDGMIGGNHRSNTELVAQGTANIFSALFAGIPATGAIARTATNVKNGGRTPIAG
ncbi:MAG: sodium-independent anion transporter, partial [Bacteroidales bacterium]|nr:sodium-independent anion transporter [Bacteroidales bacterium]